MPVHPELAALLAAWKLDGWAATYGRVPEPGDLIVPLPVAGRTRRPLEGRYYDDQRGARTSRPTSRRSSCA